MVAPALALPNSYVVAPYISNAEYRNAPTAVDTGNLVLAGSTVEQSTELSNVILRASGYVDTICGQQLIATTNTETYRTSGGRDGRIRIHPRNWPILEVSDFRYGFQPTPTSWTTMTDLTGLLVEQNMFTVGWSGAAGVSSVGPLDLTGSRAGYGSRIYGRYTYLNGWANTPVAAASIAAATTFTVVSTVGIYPGSTYVIYDGASTENVVVMSVTGSTVTVPAMQFAHSKAAVLSAMPATVKQACILLTSGLIKQRGSEAFVMQTHGGAGSGFQNVDGVSIADMAIAREMLRPFRRIR